MAYNEGIQEVQNENYKLPVVAHQANRPLTHSTISEVTENDQAYPVITQHDAGEDGPKQLVNDTVKCPNALNEDQARIIMEDLKGSRLRNDIPRFLAAPSMNTMASKAQALDDILSRFNRTHVLRKPFQQWRIKAQALNDILSRFNTTRVLRKSLRIWRIKTQSAQREGKRGSHTGNRHRQVRSHLLCQPEQEHV